MAEIKGKDDIRIYQIQKFLGLNESVDGDTQLQLGEAGDMRNWQVTPQYHLRVRPGYSVLRQFGGPVRGIWTGCVAGEQKTLCVADGGVWELKQDSLRRIGDIWDAPATMFGFGGKVYFLNGQEYLTWDGEGFVDTVEGYVPLVVSGMAPEGGGGDLNGGQAAVGVDGFGGGQMDGVLPIQVQIQFLDLPGAVLRCG